jgi:tetratricopeptide (TPR) repeat protein
VAGTAGEHLSPEEVDFLLVTGSKGSGTEDSERKIRAHLDSCELCRERVRANEVRRQVLHAMKSGAGAGRSPGCPVEDQWPLLAAGLLPESEAGDLLGHAAACDYCGLLLRRFSEDFTEALSPEEEQTLERLRSSQPDWQRRMAAKMAEAVHGKQSRSWIDVIRDWCQAMGAPAWAHAVAIVCLAIPLVQIAYVRYTRDTPNLLLSVAYSERRPFELRFAGARYGPLSQKRGGDDGSRFQNPPALLEAEAKIAQRLAAEPESPVWLQAQARVDLLEGRYQTAAGILEKALQIKPEPDSAALETDLASAYFMKAQALDRPADYEAVIGLLSRVLAARSDDPIALFNRALVYEHTTREPLAIADWKHYLKVDSSSAWAAEARQHLAALAH